MPRRSGASGRLLAPAALLAALTLTGCAEPAVTADPQPQAATKGPDASSNQSCNNIGTYRIVPSVNGSFPLLPASPAGADSTPLVRLSSTHLKNEPVTADLSVVLFGSGSPASQEFPGLPVGQEATFDGYTIRITSICDGEVRFDLVKQPG